MKNTFQILSILIIAIILCLVTQTIFGQGLVNNGAKIVLTNGSNIYIEGTTGKYTSQMNGIVTNHSTCGTIKLDGNWINNSTNTSFNNIRGRIK